MERSPTTVLCAVEGLVREVPLPGTSGLYTQGRNLTSALIAVKLFPVSRVWRSIWRRYTITDGRECILRENRCNPNKTCSKIITVFNFYIAMVVCSVFFVRGFHNFWGIHDFSGRSRETGLTRYTLLWPGFSLYWAEDGWYSVLGVIPSGGRVSSFFRFFRRSGTLGVYADGTRQGIGVLPC